MKGRKPGELERAINWFKGEYEKAVRQDWIRNPVAYALYQTWKHFDGRK